MATVRRLLALSGRLGRGPFAAVLLAVLVVVAGAAFAFAATATVSVTAIDPTLPTVLLWSAIALLVWIAATAAVRRLHDRDRSGWWLIVFVVLPWGLLGLGTLDRHGPGEAVATALAAGLGLWGAAEMLVLAGTRGANRFGPDPRHGAGPPDDP